MEFESHIWNATKNIITDGPSLELLNSKCYKFDSSTKWTSIGF